MGYQIHYCHGTAPGTPGYLGGTPGLSLQGAEHLASGVMTQNRNISQHGWKCPLEGRGDVSPIESHCPKGYGEIGEFKQELGGNS